MRYVCYKDLPDRRERRRENCWSSATQIVSIHKIFVRSWSSCYAQLTSTHYRRSVLVQGGLKIPCLVKAKMIVTEKNKRTLSHFLVLANKNYKDLLPKKEITFGSFFASENSQESETSNSVQISVVKRTASRKKKEPLNKDKNADIRKWFKKEKTSTVVKDDRNAEKDKGIVVID